MAKRLLLLSFLLATELSFGQAAAVPIGVNAYGNPATNLVAVCNTNPGSGTCSSLVTTYTDSTNGTACSGSGAALNNLANPSSGSGCSNPGSTDSKGNVLVFAAAGVYWCRFSGSGFVPYSLPCPVASSGSGGAVSSVFGRIGAVVAATNDYTPTQVGLGSVTNDAQTKAAVMPNTAPSAGQIPAGNAGGTAYAPVAVSGDSSMTSAGVMTNTKVNGGTFPATAAIIGTNGSNQPIASTPHAFAVLLACNDSSGSGTAQSCTSSPSFTPAAGDTIIYKTTTTNTGALTINVNSSSAAPARKWMASAALVAGDVILGVYNLATYDGTNWNFYTIGNAPTGSGTINAAQQFALAEYSAAGSAQTLSGIAGPTAVNSVPQFWITTPSAGAATATTSAPAGVVPNAQTGTTYTIAATDRAGYVSFSNGSSIAVTLPQSGTTGFANNFVFVGCDIGAGTATITPTTSTISYTTGSSYSAAQATLALTTGQCAWVYSDNTNYFAIVRGGAAGAPSYPVTVSGTTTSGGIPCFTSTTVESSSGILNANILTKGGGAGVCPTNSSITDNGTTIASAEPIALGTANCTTFGSAGGDCGAEGTAMTNVAGAAARWYDSAAHEMMLATNGASTGTPGMMVRRQPGAIRSTGLVAAVTTATLCAASAGACNVAGTYHIDVAFYQSGSACTTNTTGGITPTITWTDANGTAHTTVGLPLETNSSLVASSGTMLFNQTGNGIGTVFATGSFNIDTNGTIIQYAIGFAQCSVTGTANYAASLTVTRLQ